MGGITGSGGDDPNRVDAATTATASMAAYFYGALRDQTSRASVFERQLRWQRMRHALASEEALVAEAHCYEDALVDLGLTSTAVLPAQPQAAVG